jgi:hypothetical protein
MEVPDPMVKHITVKHISGGQPRPYADSEYISEIEVRADGLWASHLKEATIKEYAKVLVHPFVEGEREWHQPWLRSIKEVRHNVWRVHIVSPYLD